MNQPYIKKYDEFGNVSNFPKEGIIHSFPNRKQRRGIKQNISSTKIAKSSMNVSTVIRTGKYLLQPFNNFIKKHLPKRTQNSD